MKLTIAVTCLCVLAAVRAQAQFAPLNVQLVDPTTKQPVTAGADGTVGTTAQTTGPSLKCYGSSTAPTTVTNGQDQYVWCTTSGSVTTYSTTPDPCSGAKTLIAISQATSTQLFAGTASNRTYICSFNVSEPSASTQTYALVSGTGSTCGTGTGAMIGATTAANGMVGLFNAGGGNASIAKSGANADNVCLLQSGTDRINGVLSYVVAP